LFVFSQNGDPGRRCGEFDDDGYYDGSSWKQRNADGHKHLDHNWDIRQPAAFDGGEASRKLSAFFGRTSS
jgi:hypothetical protein